MSKQALPQLDQGRPLVSASKPSYGLIKGGRWWQQAWLDQGRALVAVDQERALVSAAMA